MFRLTAILLGFLPLMFITTIKSEDVKIIQQAQTKVYQGDEMVVEVKVEKGDIEGFAKYQLDVPEGLTAEQIEVLGATFTFDEGTIKVIWLALPSKNEFTFSYKLKIGADIPNQNFELGGRFSYLEDNNRMIAEANKVNIQIGDTEEEILAAAPKEPTSASVVRNVYPNEDGTYDIEVQVTKSNLDGFSKVEDIYPKKYEVSAIEEANGVFSFVKTKVKFVWMNTPEAETYSVRYKLDPKGEAVDFTAVLGEFSYLDDNETKKVGIIDQSGMAMASNQASELTESKEEEIVEETKAQTASEENKVVDTETNEEVVAVEENNPNSNETEEIKEVQAPEESLEENKTLAKEESSNEFGEEKTEDTSTESISASTEDEMNSSNIPTPQQGVQYRVQILAGKNLVDQQYFMKNHKYEESFITENHNGLVKYTTGEFNVYKEARNRREEINGKYVLPGPFVTAYNSGQRITVQEALMISNQKWYK